MPCSKPGWIWLICTICIRLNHDIAEPLLTYDEDTYRMVKVKHDITVENLLSKLIQAKLGSAWQNVKETKKSLQITEDKEYMISEQLKLAMMELNVKNAAMIRVKAILALISTLQPNSSNPIYNVQSTRLLTYYGTRSLDTVACFLSTLHRHIGPYAQNLGFTDQYSISLTNGWASKLQLQFGRRTSSWQKKQSAQLRKTLQLQSMRPLSLLIL